MAHIIRQKLMKIESPVKRLKHDNSLEKEMLDYHDKEDESENGLSKLCVQFHCLTSTIIELKVLPTKQSSRRLSLVKINSILKNPKQLFDEKLNQKREKKKVHIPAF